MPLNTLQDQIRTARELAEMAGDAIPPERRRGEKTDLAEFGVISLAQATRRLADIVAELADHVERLDRDHKAAERAVEHLVGGVER